MSSKSVDVPRWGYPEPHPDKMEDLFRESLGDGGGGNPVDVTDMMFAYFRWTVHEVVDPVRFEYGGPIYPGTVDLEVVDANGNVVDGGRVIARMHPAVEDN